MAKFGFMPRCYLYLHGWLRAGHGRHLPGLVVGAEPLILVAGYSGTHMVKQVWVAKFPSGQVEAAWVMASPAYAATYIERGGGQPRRSSGRKPQTARFRRSPPKR